MAHPWCPQKALSSCFPYLEFLQSFESYKVSPMSYIWATSLFYFSVGLHCLQIYYLETNLSIVCHIPKRLDLVHLLFSVEPQLGARSQWLEIGLLIFRQPQTNQPRGLTQDQNCPTSETLSEDRKGCKTRKGEGKSRRGWPIGRLMDSSDGWDNVSWRKSVYWVKNWQWLNGTKQSINYRPHLENQCRTHSKVTNVSPSSSSMKQCPHSPSYWPVIKTDSFQPQILTPKQTQASVLSRPDSILIVGFQFLWESFNLIVFFIALGLAQDALSSINLIVKMR